MNLGDLRKQIAEVQALPDDTPVKYISRTVAVKEAEHLAFRPGIGVYISEPKSRR